MVQKMAAQNNNHYFRAGRWVFCDLYPELFYRRAFSVDVLCYDAQCLPGGPALVLPAWDLLAFRGIWPSHPWGFDKFH